MSFTVQVGPVLAARLNSIPCSYWSSQASSRKGLSCTQLPRGRISFLLLILRVGARMIFSFRTTVSLSRAPPLRTSFVRQGGEHKPQPPRRFISPQNER